VGKSCDDARALIEQADLVADCQTGDAATNPDQVNQVYRVNPTGRVEVGTTITVLVYGEQAEIPTPAAPTLPATIEPGASAQVAWPGASCPAGLAVSSYNLTATNGTFANTGQSTASFGANARNAQIEAANSPGQTLTVTYTVSCSGNGQQRDSGASPEGISQISSAPQPSGSPTSNG
jgi:eukaryotic-like serine/threonine-protein kinase